MHAWETGLRRDQTSAREKTPKVEIDQAHAGIVKLNPIADWSREQVLDYVREHEVPINRLHAEGYPSVGCDPCSRAIRPGEAGSCSVANAPAATPATQGRCTPT